MELAKAAYSNWIIVLLIIRTSDVKHLLKGLTWLGWEKDTRGLGVFLSVPGNRSSDDHIRVQYIGLQTFYLSDALLSLTAV